VLPVGGMREKSLAAYRAGFRALMFPAGNLKDVDDIPLDVRDKLELIAVETMDEVFACALSRVILPQNMNGEFTLPYAHAANATAALSITTHANVIRRSDFSRSRTRHCTSASSPSMVCTQQNTMNTRQCTYGSKPSDSTCGARTMFAARNSALPSARSFPDSR